MILYKWYIKFSVTSMHNLCSCNFLKGCHRETQRTTEDHRGERVKYSGFQEQSVGITSENYGQKYEHKMRNN
jgi:hypothetical protein